MTPGSTVSTKIGCTLLVALFTWNVYEAVRRPVTPDEAYDFVHFIRPKFRDVVREFDPRDHVLHTILVKRTVGLFRLSALSMRLPGLLAVGFFFWAVYRIGMKSLVIVVVLVLNPFVLGHLWAAGGDAVGLALWAWGLERLIFRDRNVAGLLLGLSIGASIGFVLPVALLICMWLAGSPERWAVVERAGLTALVTAFILVSIPLSRWDGGPVRGAVRFSVRPPAACAPATEAIGDCREFYRARRRSP